MEIPYQIWNCHRWIKSLIVWSMASGTYFVTEIVNFYSDIMKPSIRSSWKPCRHFLMHKCSLLTIHIYFLAVVFIVLMFILKVVVMVFMFFHVFRLIFAHFLNEELTLSPHISNKQVRFEFSKVVSQII